jgi:hypothetical protein
MRCNKNLVCCDFDSTGVKECYKPWLDANDNCLCSAGRALLMKDPNKPWKGLSPQPISPSKAEVPNINWYSMNDQGWLMG